MAEDALTRRDFIASEWEQQSILTRGPRLMTIRAAIVLGPLCAIAFAAFCATMMFVSHLP